MKTLKIYFREITTKTGFKSKLYAFKKSREYVVYCGDKVIYETQYLNNFVENPKCKNHGSMILKTRSEKVARTYFEKARVNQEENKVKQAINNYLDKEEK